MKHTILGLLVAGVMATGSMAAVGAYAATGHGHEHAAGAPAATPGNDGQKWASDEPLRQGMSRIRDAVDAKLPAIHGGALSAAQYEALGGEIDAQIAHIVQNCKLEPAADQALHTVLAGMMEGNDKLRGKNAGVDRSAGVIQVVRSLEQYAELFQDPGFQAPKAGH